MLKWSDVIFMVWDVVLMWVQKVLVETVRFNMLVVMVGMMTMMRSWTGFL